MDISNILKDKIMLAGEKLENQSVLPKDLNKDSISISTFDTKVLSGFRDNSKERSKFSKANLEALNVISLLKEVNSSKLNSNSL